MTFEPPASTRSTRWAWGAVVAGVICLGFLLILSVDPRYFYVDDTESGAVGNWIQLGHLMREGQWFPTLVLDQWMAGNYPVEGQGGLWNPVQMAINYAAPSVDNLALLATAVKLGFSIVLGWGVYRVAMEYGARPAWAAVAGAAAPFGGFTLYFEDPSWVTSLIGMAWVVQAWASGVRYARGRSGPLPLFAFLYLAISVGYAHSALMAGVLIGCLMIGEYLYQRRWRPSLLLGGAGVAAAACGAITFLPGMLSSSVTWRTGEEGALNDNFLTAPWSETFTASIPSSVSSIESWTGETTTAPITYIAWFAIPALAFIAWRKAQPALREFSAPLLLLGFILLFTSGPSDIGQIRWPARLLPFVAVISLVLLAALLSRYGTTRPLRPRLVAAGLLVLVLVLRASSSGPQYFGRHVMWGALIAVFGVLALYLARRFGDRAVAALLIATSLPILFYQVSTYSPVLSTWHLPSSQSEAKSEFPRWEGTTLQLGTRSLTEDAPDSPDLPWHSQVYGNYAKVLDLDYVNAYTPIGHQGFGDLLCIKYEGSTCKDAFRNVFAIDRYTGKTFADLMLLDRVVVQKAQHPGLDRKPAPEGWQWVTPPETSAPRPASDQIYVLERIDGRVSDQPGRVSATVGADAVPESASVNSERVRVTSPNGGSVIFARLAWPGYRATLDGQPLQTKGLGDTFLYVDVPPGTDNAELEITFRPPGQRLGFAAAGFGLVLLVGQTGLYYYRDRPRYRVRTTVQSPSKID
ncbi:hypothetical protein O4215_18930 [Rhodococcus maanshanensis]|uniref:hypothetical protein n=1 Tax=Rhodococcus maanshanensis TaxID=183556 RepID=UPI0022B5930D|nr:hypothetical protein [Rhodococcus maanshanensis]MCZ4557641.1 hypothetical protein [Rhodococcus maanshanensis]